LIKPHLKQFFPPNYIKIPLKNSDYKKLIDHKELIPQKKVSKQKNEFEYSFGRAPNTFAITPLRVPIAKGLGRVIHCSPPNKLGGAAVSTTHAKNSQFTDSNYHKSFI
jgi:hypothetical protein